ncbi:MAG: hypothetical protein U0805_12075 [Pirellulales bacterium]
MADMHVDEVVYDGSAEQFAQLPTLLKEGKRILCRRCRSELIIALDLETANRLKVHTGVYCPKNSSHVCILIELVDARRKILKFFSELNDRQ